VTVEEFLHTYAAPHRYTVFPIKSFDGALEGVVTLRNLSRVDPDQRRATRVSDLACPMSAVPTAKPDEQLSAVLPRMSGSCSEGRLLVFDGPAGDQLVGILSPADVTRLLLLRGVPA
jgi:CBS domain-containing protein